MKLFYKSIIAAFCVIMLNSCSTTVHFLCNQSDVAIYIEDQFMGYNQISYVVPKGVEYVRVSCRVDGLEIYSNTYYVKHENNRLFDIILQDNYKYSTNPIIIHSH